MSGNSTTVDLKGDNASLKKALAESQKMVGDFAGAVKSAFVVVAAALAARELFQFGASMVAAANESEDAFVKLQAVVKATGGAAGYSAEQMAYMADSLEETTKFSSEAVQQAQAVIATFRNIRGKEFDEATRAAADMATVLGTDLAGASTQVAKALNDPLQGITALSKAGVTFSDSQKEAIAAMIKAGNVAGAQQIILSELRSEYGGAAEAMGETFSGKLEQMQTRLGNIGEELGGAIIGILDALMPLADGAVTMLENIAPIAVEVIQGLVEWGNQLFDSMKPVFDWMIDAGITIFTGLEMVVTNFSDIAIHAMLNYQYNVVSSFGVITHLLSTTMPELLMWFANNWKEIFLDIGHYVGTAVTNMGKNIYDFMKAVAGYLAGDGFNFEFTALTKGMEKALTKFPELTKRIPGELEQSLIGPLNKSAENLANTFGEKFNEKKKFLSDMLKPKEREKMDLTDNAEKVDAKDLKGGDEKTKTPKQVEAKMTEVKEEKTDKKDNKQSDGFKASFEGLESLSSRIQSAAASSQKDDATKELVKTNKELAQGMLKLQDVLHTGVVTLKDSVFGMMGKDTLKNASRSFLTDGLGMLGTVTEFAGFGQQQKEAEQYAKNAKNFSSVSEESARAREYNDKRYLTVAERQVTVQETTAAASVKIAETIANVGKLF